MEYQRALAELLSCISYVCLADVLLGFARGYRKWLLSGDEASVHSQHDTRSYPKCKSASWDNLRRLWFPLFCVPVTICINVTARHADSKLAFSFPFICGLPQSWYHDGEVRWHPSFCILFSNTFRMTVFVSRPLSFSCAPLPISRPRAYHTKSFISVGSRGKMIVYMYKSSSSMFARRAMNKPTNFMDQYPTKPDSASLSPSHDVATLQQQITRLLELASTPGVVEKESNSIMSVTREP